MNGPRKNTAYLVIGALVLAPASYAADRLCEDLPECDGSAPLQIAELLTVGSTSGPQLVRNTVIGDDLEFVPISYVESERRYSAEDRSFVTRLSAGQAWRQDQAATARAFLDVGAAPSPSSLYIGHPFKIVGPGSGNGSRGPSGDST